MSVSVIIPCHNDPYIWFTLNALYRYTPVDAFEIVLIDDCSDVPLLVNPLLYPNLRVLRNTRNRGVGQSFDIGMVYARNETVVLMGADVIVKNKNWVEIAEKYTSENSYSIGCSVCLSGAPRNLDPDNPADDVKRYGATIMPFVTTEDLPSDSSLLDIDSYYVGAFESKWIKNKPSKRVAEIPSVYGAMYVTTKSWYKYIQGWDNSHRGWGSLEPWISMKSWLYGGKCHCITELKSLHVFHKHDLQNPDFYVPSSPYELFYYNKLFIAHTQLIPQDALRLICKIYDTKVRHELPTYQFNLAKKLIQQNWEKVDDVRIRNEKNFVHDFDWYCEKFGITKNF